MRVNNQFNISDCWKQSDSQDSCSARPGSTKKGCALFLVSSKLFYLYLHLFYLFHFRDSSKCYIYWIIISLRKQPSFFAPGPSGVSREMPLGRGAKKDGCFRRLDYYPFDKK